MGKSLNRQIAEMLGYFIYHYDKDVEDRCYYQLWQPLGGMAINEDWQRRTEGEAWNDSPKWSRDIGLALGLWRGYSGWCIESGERGAYKVSYTAFKSNVTQSFNCSSVEDIAEKLCELWVKHVDPQKLERDRKIEVLLQKKYALEEELRELDPDWDRLD